MKMPPWINPWLLLAEAVSFGLHFLILYVPFLANTFGIVPLTFHEWVLVITFAAPVIMIDEVSCSQDMCFCPLLLHVSRYRRTAANTILPCAPGIEVRWADIRQPSSAQHTRNRRLAKENGLMV